MNKYIAPVPLEKAFRLINHGATTLVSSRYGGIDNVMAAAWVCGLDYDPPKLTFVLDSQNKTRQLVEKSGMFAVQIPTLSQLELTHWLGTHSLYDDPQKLEHSGVELFSIDGFDVPLVSDCAAWLICKVIPEPHNEQTYDLFIGEIISAWSDTRIFHNGHWQFESADASWRSLHYIAGGHFYAIGDSFDVQSK